MCGSTSFYGGDSTKRWGLRWYPHGWILKIFEEPKVVIDNSLEIGQVFTISGRKRHSDPWSSPFEEYVSISIQIDTRNKELGRERNASQQGLPIRGPGETVDPPPLWQREIPLSAILQIEYADLFSKLSPARKSDVRTVRRNAPLQVVRMSQLSPNDFPTLPLHGIQGMENKLALFLTADDT
jgi:hypothetical protein